ncbi:MAG: MAPEG family protein [Sulfitobacter sp.]
MTPELIALTLAALLQYVQFGLYAVPANLEMGSGYTMSARDRAPSKQVSEKTARLGRAFDNHFQGLILFTIAVTVTQMSGQNSGFSATCAWIFLLARVAYVPAYAFGLRPWRSVIWMVGMFSTLLILIAALF